MAWFSHAASAVGHFARTLLGTRDQAEDDDDGAAAAQDCPATAPGDAAIARAAGKQPVRPKPLRPKYTHRKCKWNCASWHLQGSGSNGCHLHRWYCCRHSNRSNCSHGSQVSLSPPLCNCTIKLISHRQPVCVVRSVHRRT